MADQAVHLPLDDLEQLQCGLGAEVLLFAEQADSGLQDCQRCAEFMGRAAGEVPLHDEDLVQPLGHLIERQGQCGRLIPAVGISTAAPDPQPSAPGSGK